GLAGLLQSPIKGAERHGLPGVLSGIKYSSWSDWTGGKTSSQVRLPRHLNRELPLRPYSWEEAIGVSVLREAEDPIKLKDETLVLCKALRDDGKFVILTERLILIVSCPSIVKYKMPEFQGVPANPEWLVETEIGMDSVIHADNDDDEVHIVGSSSDASLRQNHISHQRSWGPKGKRWNNKIWFSHQKMKQRTSVHLLHQSILRQL
ncbi:hypothetical protein MTR67_048783, partial [Solanum verrucosum]